MKAIEVTARFEADGQVVPLQFIWDGHTYPVNQVGRRWQDAAGEHFLVMIPGEKVVELVFSQTESLWFISIPAPGYRSKV